MSIMLSVPGSGSVSETGRRAAAWICFAIAMVDGFDTLLVSFIAPLISKEWQLVPARVGQIFAVSYAGAAFGAASMGFAADRWGRRKLLLAALIVSAAGTFACSLATNATELMIWRALSGLGLGGAIPAISAITASQAGPRDRSVAVTRMFLGYPIGALVGGTLTAAFMGFGGWRGVFMGAGFVTCCLVPLAGRALPESRAPSSHSQRLVTAVFGSNYLAGTLLLCLATFLVLLVTYFLVSWTPTVLSLGGVAPPQAAMSAVLLNLGGLVGALVMSGLTRRHRAALIVAGCLAVGSALTVMLGRSVLMVGLIAFPCAFAVGVFVIGAQANLPALTVRFYPPSLYASGVGLSMSCGRIGSILGPLIGGYLASAGLGWPRLFLIAALPPLLAGVAVAGLNLPEDS
jgi:MFS transporter, AAHS family, 4-hydroxybenzoate transporter